MPFGRKTDIKLGTDIDLDRIYRVVVQHVDIPFDVTF
jgi:hypothetical protein